MNYNYLSRNSNPTNNELPFIHRQSRQSGNGLPPNGRNIRISQNSQSKPEDAYKIYQEKLKALGRVKYKNQLAQMEYEEKLTQLHTKYSARTKQSVQKKMKAKNQIADFIDEQQQQFGQQFEELMDYKYGATKWKNFYYENQNNTKNYTFCSLCDEIYSSNEKDHQKICKYSQLARSPLYYRQSIDRINNCLLRLTSQQAEELKILIAKMRRNQNIERQLLEMMPLVKGDEVLEKITAKLQQIIEQTR